MLPPSQIIGGGGGGAWPPLPPQPPSSYAAYVTQQSGAAYIESYHPCPKSQIFILSKVNTDEGSMKKLNHGLSLVREMTYSLKFVGCLPVQAYKTVV